MARVLLIYDSREGLVQQLADAISDGISSVVGAELISRTVNEAARSELLTCDALILGSANWTGVTGALKTWMDESGDLWESGELAGKPSGVFAAGWSPHGGLEATLLQLVHLVVGHGMIFVGLPWSERMRRSGSYYGATAVGVFSDDDREQARSLGKRVAQLALQLEKQDE